MRVRRVMLSLFVLAACTAAVVVRVSAQAPAPAAGQAATSRVHGTMLQVMRGILFPNANVIYTVQDTDPATIKPDADPSTSPNPLTSAYGGWTAVENAGLALAESANLLTIPGRVCSNGKPVPLGRADWSKFVQELRDAGMAAAAAGKAKNQDMVLEAADKMTMACSNCHDVYREKRTGPQDRCLP